MSDERDTKPDKPKPTFLERLQAELAHDAKATEDLGALKVPTARLYTIGGAGWEFSKGLAAQGLVFGGAFLRSAALSSLAAEAGDMAGRQFKDWVRKHVGA